MTMQEIYPNVSVIILSYNASKYIEALLESLSDQTYPKEHIEIIVVDNFSTDNTLSLVKNKYPHVKRVALDRNLGFAAGNNEGLKYARYDFLIFLNQDTICHRHWLSGLMNIMLENKEIRACTSNIVSSETDEFRRMNRQAPLSSLYFYDLSPFGYGRYIKDSKNRFQLTRMLSGCSFIIHRDTLEQLGYLFDEELWMYVEDTDLSLRIYNLGQRVCATRDSVVYHLHESSVRLSSDRLYVAARAIMNRVYVFYKNMAGLEFLLYLPFLFFGGGLKIFEFPLKASTKVMYFIPFSLFSAVCMLFALVGLPRFAVKRRLVLKKRRVKNFHILTLLLKHN